MDKQRPVNKVVHNDAYSASLMEMYTQWMDGDCFQGSNIPEAFEGMDPQSHGAEVEEITKKKGGKEVNNCVKAGFEPEGEEIKEKKLDPVGKEDKDVDNDGDHDKSDKYLLARRKKVSKIIGMSKKK